MNGLSRATVTRLPSYLRLLDEMRGAHATVSSVELANAAGVNPPNVRRDLSDLGFQGTRGVGYSVEALRTRIRKELRVESHRKVAIIGAGNLGTALAGYGGLRQSGFDVVAVYDNKPDRIGESIGELTVRDAEYMGADCRAGLFELAVLAVPASVAQVVAEELMAAGVSSILNFAPTRVSGATVPIRRVDLSTELQVLSYYA